MVLQAMTFNFMLCTVQCSTIVYSVSYEPCQIGQNHRDSARNLRGWWLLVERIQAEIWVVSEIRIHAELQGNFQIRVEMRGKFLQTCERFNRQRLR